MQKHFVSRLIFSVLTALIVVLGACGQGGTVDGKVAAAQSRNDAPPIWLVKDKDSKLYLYGTVHLLPSDLIWQKDDMSDAFSEAGTVFFEVDTTEVGKMTATNLTQALGFQPSGQRLSERMDSYQLKLLEAAANNGAVRREAIDSMQPWLASQFLVATASASAGLSADLSADEALKSRARRMAKNILYLDSVEAQIRATADQSEFVQMNLLTETLEHYNNLEDELRRVAESWAIGDTKTLQTITVAPMKARSPDVYRSMFIDRNQRWADQFERFLDSSGTGFAAVGVGHLLGEDSVQSMLRERGFVVTRYYAFQGEPVIKPVELGG